MPPITTQLALKPVSFLTILLLCTASGFAQMPNPYWPPIVMEGSIVGAIGVSGGTYQQDGQCAKASVDTIK
jgi:hypothetical protein